MRPNPLLHRLLGSQDGASAAEYALILAVVGTAIAVGALALGTSISGSMDQQSNTIKNCGGRC